MLSVRSLSPADTCTNCSGKQWVSLPSVRRGEEAEPTQGGGPSKYNAGERPQSHAPSTPAHPTSACASGAPKERSSEFFCHFPSDHPQRWWRGRLWLSPTLELGTIGLLGALGSEQEGTSTYCVPGAIGLQACQVHKQGHFSLETVRGVGTQLRLKKRYICVCVCVCTYICI